MTESGMVGYGLSGVADSYGIPIRGSVGGRKRKARKPLIGRGKKRRTKRKGVKRPGRILNSFSKQVGFGRRRRKKRKTCKRRKK